MAPRPRGSNQARRTDTEWDVVIAGGGNAALCAAITAAEAGCRVIILEGAPKPYRGGNSRHTRNFRCMHEGPMSVLTDAYLEDEYFDDLLRVTKGRTDERLARMVIRSSQECLPWMQAHGVHFQPSLSGTLSLSPSSTRESAVSWPAMARSSAARWTRSVRAKAGTEDSNRCCRPTKASRACAARPRPSPPIRPSRSSR